MVTQWGMSEKLGPLLYGEKEDMSMFAQRQNMSEETARLIDQEIRRYVTEGEQKAWELLTAHRPQLEAITAALMEFETISGEECKTIMRGEKIIRKLDDDGNSGVGSAVPTTRARPRSEPSGGFEPQPTT